MWRLISGHISLAFFALCLTAGTLTAQPITDVEVSMRWGDRQKAPSNSQIAKVIQAGSWGARVLRYRTGRGFANEKYWIEHYDAQMDLIGRFEFELPGERKGDLEDIISLRNQLYLLTSRPDATGELSQLWLRPVSDRGQVVREDQLIATLPVDEKFRRRQFDLEFNRDSSFILMYNQRPPERKGPERFTLRVFDETMEPVWSRKVELPHLDRGFSIRSYQVDQEGNVFLLGRKEPDNPESGETPHYYVYAYTRAGQQETVYRLDLADVQLNRLVLRIAGNGDMVCAGFYGAPGQKSNAGVCHIRINPLTQEAYKVHLLPFTSDFLSNSLENAREGGSAATRFYQIRELILRSDGGIVLTAEQYYRTESQGASLGMGVPLNTLFYYNDIMVANVAPDGTYTWLRSIPKQQLTANDNGRFSSFAQATAQSRFIFLYNDHPDQYRLDNERTSNLEEQNTVVSVTEVNRSGEVTTMPLFFNKDVGVKTRPRRCRQISANQILIYGEEGRSYRLGLLTF